MSLTGTDHPLSAQLLQAIIDPRFPSLDSALRSGRHISCDELAQHAFLMDFQQPLSHFYLRYNAELHRAPEGFFYLYPRSTSLIPRGILSELEMMIGKVLCYLYLSPERINQHGLFSDEDLYQTLFTLVDENRLLKMVNQRASGSDLDRQKVVEKVNSALNRLRRLGMVLFVDGQRRFSITEAVFRFAADLRSGEDQATAQQRLIRDGEAVPATGGRVQDLGSASGEEGEPSTLDDPLNISSQQGDTDD